ncbi:MAG: hypothetical protein AAF662_06495 [Pseudomonadota bacterium]
MRKDLKARVTALEAKASGPMQRVIVKQREGETRADMKARVEAWMRGEPGVELDCSTREHYAGGFLVITSFVSQST